VALDSNSTAVALDSNSSDHRPAAANRDGRACLAMAGAWLPATIVRWQRGVREHREAVRQLAGLRRRQAAAEDAIARHSPLHHQAARPSTPMT